MLDLIALLVIMGAGLIAGGQKKNDNTSQDSDTDFPEAESKSNFDIDSYLPKPPKYTFSQRYPFTSPTITSPITISEETREIMRANAEKWYQEQSRNTMADLYRNMNPCENRDCAYCSYNDQQSWHCKQRSKLLAWQDTSEGKETLARQKKWRDDEFNARMRELDSRARDIEMNLMRIRIGKQKFQPMSWGEVDRRFFHHFDHNP